MLYDPLRYGVLSSDDRIQLMNAGNMDVDAWRQRQVSKRLEARLKSQTQSFAERHGKETDEQLKEYVRRKAVSLRRMPHPLELPGGIYLNERMGDWNLLAREFGVMPVSSRYGKQAYQRLRERETLLLIEERKAIKAEKRQRAKALNGSCPDE